MRAIFDRLSPQWQSRFATFGFLCASLILASSATRLFLPQSSLEGYAFEQFNFSKPYPLDRAMAISNSSAPIAAGGDGGAALPLSSLRLKAVYAEDEKKGFIAIEEGRAILFASIGDQVRGYTLVSASGRKAILARDGVNYELKMDDRSDVGEVRIVPSASSLETAQKKRVVARDELDQYQKDPRMIWDNIGITPVTQNGKFKEFRVTFVAKDSVFSELGLQAGDVLKSANGVELDGYAAALRLYADINNIDSLRLSIIRNNQIKELSYEIR